MDRFKVTLVIKEKLHILTWSRLAVSNIAVALKNKTQQKTCLYLVPGNVSRLILDEDVIREGDDIETDLYLLEDEHFQITSDSHQTIFGQRVVVNGTQTDENVSMMVDMWENEHKDFQVSISLRSCREAVVHWNEEGNRKAVPECTDYILFVVNSTSKVPQYMFRIPSGESKFRIPKQIVKKGKEYGIIVMGMKKTPLRTDILGHYFHGSAIFRAVFTEEELQTLRVKAVQFARTNWKTWKHPQEFYQCQFIYRNKPKEYYDEIMSSDGVMKKMVKNMNGDLGCPINGQIMGMYFGTNVDVWRAGSLPPSSSFFGDKSLRVPAHLMLNQNNNLYFADFYCHRYRHKVTLIVTKPGSQADIECQKSLVQLDVAKNDFLFISNGQRLLVTSGLWLEVFYTEEISVKSLLTKGAFFKGIRKLGWKKDYPGIPKRKDCYICNIDD